MFFSWHKQNDLHFARRVMVMRSQASRGSDGKVDSKEK